MKAPKFIIKRVYIERNDQRELKTHKKRLDNIQVEDVKKRVKTTNETQMNLQANKSIISEYMAKAKHDSIERENNQILKKLVDIAKGKTTLSSMSKGQTATIQPSIITNTNNMTNTNTSTMMRTLNTNGRKKEYERINEENEKIAKRLMKINPVISSKSHSKDFQNHVKIGEQILRFHVLKEKEDKEYDYERRRKEQEEAEEKQKMMDPEYRKMVEELNNQQVYLHMELQNLKFYQKKFEPITETDQYFMEIKACYKAFRRTIPELYKDFSKSVINEFFNMNELRKTKLLYIGLYKLINEKEIFIGDFEMDLAHYMANEDNTAVSFELQNLKNPPKNYLPKDLDFRGLVYFKVQLKLNVAKSKKLVDPTSPSRKKYAKQTSQVMFEGMNLSKKYTDKSIELNKQKTEKTIVSSSALNLTVGELIINNNENSKITEKTSVFTKFEVGTQNAQTNGKNQAIAGKIDFNENLSIIINKDENILKISTFYIENENSYVFIGIAIINIFEIEGIYKDNVIKQVKLEKDGKESGVLSIKLHITE